MLRPWVVVVQLTQKENELEGGKVQVLCYKLFYWPAEMEKFKKAPQFSGLSTVLIEWSCTFSSPPKENLV